MQNRDADFELVEQIQTLLAKQVQPLDEADPAPAATFEARIDQLQEAMEQEDFSRAADLTARLLAEDPLDQSLLYAMGQCLLALEEFAQALDFSLAAMVLDATDPWCVCQIGECLAALGHPSEARDAFETAIALSWLDPSHEPAREQAQQWIDHLTKTDL